MKKLILALTAYCFTGIAYSGPCFTDTGDCNTTQPIIIVKPTQSENGYCTYSLINGKEIPINCYQEENIAQIPNLNTQKTETNASPKNNTTHITTSTQTQRSNYNGYYNTQQQTQTTQSYYYPYPNNNNNKNNNYYYNFNITRNHIYNNNYHRPNRPSHHWQHRPNRPNRPTKPTPPPSKPNTNNSGNNSPWTTPHIKPNNNQNQWHHRNNHNNTNQWHHRNNTHR